MADHAIAELAGELDRKLSAAPPENLSVPGRSVEWS